MGKCLFMRKGETHTIPGSRLPFGYTELVYIESNGAPCINTEVVPNQDTKVVMDFTVTSTAATGWLFCGRTTSSSAAFGVYAYQSTGKFYAAYGADKYTFSLTVRDAIQRCVFDKNVVTIDSESYSFAEQSFEASTTLYLLARNTAGTLASYAYAKLYACQIYDNGTLVRDFVPCVDPAGNVGLYDLVTQAFFGNAGTGTFIGSEVA